MECIVANVTGRARRVQKDGREWLAAPCTLIVPGVMHGSEGPIYYPGDRTAPRASRWNGFPLVKDHPFKDGKAASVKEDGYAEKFGLGLVQNAHGDARGRTRAEAWFDEARLREVSPKILADLLDARPVSLSTSMRLATEPAPAGVTHNGRPYALVAVDFEPDHVAVFEEQPGACSILDGCGVLVGNALSHRTLHERLAALIRERHSAPGPEGEEPPFLVDVFDKYAVFARRGDLYRVGYTTDLRTDAVALSDERPEEVTLTTSYRPVSNSEPEPQPREESPTMPLTPEQRREAVALLVANCACQANVPWRGMSQQAIESLDDGTLAAYGQWQKSLASNSPAPQPQQPQAQPPAQPRPALVFPDGSVQYLDGAARPAPQPQPAPVQNSPAPQPPAPRGRTVEEWVAERFPGYSLEEAEGSIRQNLERARHYKAGLIERLTSNMAVGDERDRASAAYDRLRPEELELLVSAHEQQQQQRRQVANYAGLPGAPVTSPGAHGKPEPLLPPAFNGGGPNWR